MTDTAPRGRPQSASREMMQEAAFELFLENGYARTTVEQIAQRAGVSRNTFFNHFAGKSDVFWIDLDFSLDALSDGLREASTTTAAMDAVQGALVGVARQLGPHRVPWALTHYDMLGGAQELQSSALQRLTSHVRVIADFLTPRFPGPDAPMLARSAAYAAIGATVAAAQAWAAASTSRGELVPYLEAALAPVCAGFELATARPTLSQGPATL